MADGERRFNRPGATLLTAAATSYLDPPPHQPLGSDEGERRRGDDPEKRSGERIAGRRGGERTADADGMREGHHPGEPLPPGGQTLERKEHAREAEHHREDEREVVLEEVGGRRPVRDHHAERDERESQ